MKGKRISSITTGCCEHKYENNKKEPDAYRYGFYLPLPPEKNR
jgi:hypothetical protein